MANNNPNNNNIDIGAVVDRLDKLLVIMTRQSQGSQYGEIHGSQIRGDGLSSLSYSGGYYGDIARKSADRLTSAEQSSLIRRSGLDASGLNKERAKEGKILEKLNRQLYKRERLLKRIEEAEKRLYEIRNENSQQANEEKTRLGNKIEVLSRRKEVSDRNVDTRKNEAKAVSEEIRKVLEPLIKEAQRIVKAQDAKRKFDEDREKHRIKWFKSPQAYERNEDFLKSNDKNRNDLRRISDIVQQTGITNTTIPVVGEFGRAINKGLNTANQVLNIGDAYSQVKAMFGGGSSNSKVLASGASGGSVPPVTPAVAQKGIESLSKVSNVAEEVETSMAATGGSAATAAAGLATVAAVAGAVVAAFEVFKAGLGAAAQYMLNLAAGNLAAADVSFKRQQEQEQKEQKKLTEFHRLTMDKEVQTLETENAIKVKAAETSAAISIETARVEAQKRIMAQEYAARQVELATQVTTGLLKDGINATAWNALRSNIELMALKQTQAIETRKLEKELGITQAQKGAELGIEKSKQSGLLGAFMTKRGGEYENVIGGIEQEWAARGKELAFQGLKQGSETEIMLNTDMKGRYANFSAEHPELAILSPLQGIYGAGSAIGKSGTDITARSILENGVRDATTGRNIKYDEYLNNTNRYFSNPSDRDAAKRISKMAKDSGFWTWASDMMGGKATEQLKMATQTVIAQQMHPTLMNKIRQLGQIERSGITIEGEYRKTQSNINTQAQIGAIAANAAATISKTQADAVAQIEKRWVEAGKTVATAWMEMAQKLEETISDMEEKTNDFGISQGYIDRVQLRGFEKAMFQSIRDDVSRYGVDMAKYIEMRAGYSEASNRNGQFTGGDNRQMAALYKVMGHDSGFVAEYAGAMELFNQGVGESVDQLDKAMQKVNKVGLNGRKYAKEVVQNLKLAQKYNFKEGTEGLMRMTQWAMKTRFNMQNLGSMIDKVLDGGLDGVIEQSSRLQVLGGNAAIYSDPFAMMFEAGADPEAYAKRISNMAKGFGSVNRKTGQTEFNWNEVLLLREIAKNSGQDVGDIMNQIRSTNRRDSVKLAMSASRKSLFNEDQLDYMGNLAHYSKEKGGFAVDVWDKNRGEFVERGVNEISPDDLKNLQPVEHNERMEKYVLDIRSAVEKISGEEIWQKSYMGNETFDALLENADKRSEIAHEKFMNLSNTYVQKTLENWYAASAALPDMIGGMNNASNGLDGAANKIAESTNKLAKILEGLVNNLGNKATDMNANINGTLKISSNGQQIDIIEALRNDPQAVKELAQMIFRQGTINSNGGRSSHPINDGNRNTYNR